MNQKYGDDPATWPEYRRAMKHELNAAGIPEDTIFQLVNSRYDYPQAVPIMVDWLQNLDERIPAEEDRRAWRVALIRNLITKNAKGNRVAADILFHQFDIDPPLSGLELEVTGFALAEVCDGSDFPRVAALLRSGKDFSTKFELVRWLGRFKTEEAKELVVSQLADPTTRAAAMAALVRQRATGVRVTVARYLNDEVWRKEAQKTLDKLPPD
ncbi:HEAT repeat domain-containing protein [Mycobacterium persicum]|uniref:HEAT repeat domain-containing protein n=1 Tax=Mycobacterium persicum TaxID=1487726 RepID=UPI000C06D392|nr:HEAT repeat domain-containing protein [Mycobacterium persicum]